MNDIPVKDILSNEALTFNENETINIVDSKMSEAEVTEAVIINDRNEYIGKVSIYDLLKSKLNKQIPVRKVINQNHLVLDSKITLVKSIEEASKFVGEFIPVKNNDDNRYVGSINESDLFQAYLKLQNQVLHVEKDTDS